MNIYVMNRNQAIAYSNDFNIRPCRIISINNIDDELSNINSANPAISDILFLSFDDVEKDMPSAITPSDAKKIIDFVENRLSDEDIIVHCRAGQSRSAGVAGALMKIYNNDDTPIFNSNSYFPNMTCYRAVIDEVLNRIDNGEDIGTIRSEQKNKYPNRIFCSHN